MKSNTVTTAKMPKQAILAASDRWLSLYDAKIGLLGNLDAKTYTNPAYCQKYFRPFGPRAVLHSYRESAAVAFCLLDLKKQPEIANQLLATVLRQAQIKNPGHPDCGEFFWYWEEKRLRDRNANFFIGIALMLIHHLEQPDLTPANQKALACALRLMYRVFKREVSLGGSLTYVNPRLGAHAMHYLLAEEFFPKDADTAAKTFAEYIQFLLQRGINESYTPNYYGVDLIILYTILLLGKNERLKHVARQLLDELIHKEMAFFGDRFSAPFRRGYNHEFRAYNRSWFNYCLGLSPTYQVTQPDCYKSAVIYPLIRRMKQPIDGILSKNQQRAPRTMRGVVFDDCVATSYLSRHFLLGSFNYYPPITTCWQTVSTGGSGWQDCTLFLSTTTPHEITGALRLEAIDATGNKKTHPYSAPFNRKYIENLYPHFSFPPEPRVWTVQKDGHALCLYKVDKVDAELRGFAWNFFLSRFQGRVLTLAGRPLRPGNRPRRIPGGVILELDDLWLLLQPLERVDMGRSDLLTALFVPPSVDIFTDRAGLNLSLPHYRGPGRRFVQNHVAGGFFLLVKEKTASLNRQRFLAYVRDIKITDCWERDRVNASVDRRDGQRRVEVQNPDHQLALACDNYENKTLIRTIDGQTEKPPRCLREISFGK